MKASLILRIVCLAGVILSAVFYVQIRNQKLRLENNLNLSRIALQEKIEESASLKSRVFNAEESSKEKTERAEEESVKAKALEAQFDDLKSKTDEADAARMKAEDELSRLSSYNRDLQREVNNLKAAVPPQNWREQLNRLQSRLLELEAENASLKKSLASTGGPAANTAQTPTFPTLTQPQVIQPVGKVIRIGPDSSFAILSYGRQLGAVEGQTLTIRRGKQVVALVSITQITNDFSIAQILSSTNTDSSLSVPDIQVGDTAHLE
jgi:predicted RNase H-like nuclease (RuvC/YqgF family)